MGGGLHVRPGDVRAAVSFFYGIGGVARVKQHWEEQVVKLKRRAEALKPGLVAIRKEVGGGQYSMRSILHIPLHADPLDRD